MEFGSKGWLDQYLQFRQQQPFSCDLPTSGLKIREENSECTALDQAIYCFLQPTGLIYGFPLGLPFDRTDYPNFQYFNYTDQAQLVFLESLFACLIADRYYHNETELHEEALFQYAVDHSFNYFLDHYDHKLNHKKVAGSNEAFKYNKVHERFETILNKRIRFNFQFSDFPSYFHNSLLFLDLYYCILHQRYHLTGNPLDQANYEHYFENFKEVKKAILKIIILAAQANGEIEEHEEKIFEQFVHSAKLSAKEKKAIQKELKQTQGWDDLEIPDVPWLVKRYFLELALLTVMADHKVDEAEQDFLYELTSKLDLTTDELDQSFTALETFLLQYKQQLNFLEKKPQMSRMQSKLQEHASKIIQKNKDRLKNEIRESHELYTLLAKWRTENLTPAEKEKVREQLVDILKTLPVFVIIGLPGTFMTLPFLLSILPKSVFPSSFQK